ncbi:MAG TPA: ribose-5-phosphate isomerase RpiA [Blastocatellia bacterium]|nr:ribose-5-phosphate isomerase RpiA [Blastocatellia bacterium]
MGEPDTNASKLRAAERALEFVRSGQTVGLGTGSTSAFVLEGLGRLVRSGLNITGVATSTESERLARSVGIPVVELNDVARIDLTIDGADEIDEEFNMIKGGGGALAREKLVALASDLRVMVVDSSKLVPVLGVSRALPVEVLPFAWSLAARLLEKLGCTVALRERGSAPFVTDNSNYILDCKFPGIPEAARLEKTIKQVPGVVESGLFVGIADKVIVGSDTGTALRCRRE